MKFIKNIILACLVLTLISCSKITQNNFDKVQPGMTMDQTIAILGEPTTTSSIDIAGISGSSATWKTKHAEIDIQFINNKVQIKNFSKN